MISGNKVARGGRGAPDEACGGIIVQGDAIVAVAQIERARGGGANVVALNRVAAGAEQVHARVAVGGNNVAVSRVGSADDIARGIVDDHAVGVAAGEQARYIRPHEVAGNDIRTAAFDMDALGAETIDDQAAHAAVARQ